MNIYFYEEFPTKKNFDKIKLINFPTKLLIAAKSLKEFYSIKNKIIQYKNNNIKEVIYWPVLSRQEGYWFSAFTKNSALKRTINELKQHKKPLTIMWDAELPIKPSLFFTQALNYFRNRKLILDFFKNAKKCKINILTSEYPLESRSLRNILFDLFLISFDPKKYRNKKIAMLYTSLLKNHPNIENFLERQISIGTKIFGNEFMIALGTIASGVTGGIPILQPAELERDLKIAKDNKINEVVIFRLGGLNKAYINVIIKFI